MPEGAAPDKSSVADHARESLKQTALTDRHQALGARLIPFAGWLMPVQYAGIIEEHRAVRSRAGLFDLGHMGQVNFSGPDALAYLQAVTTNDVSTLEPGAAQYSLLPNEQGGIIDDIIVYKWPTGDDYFVVINAANADKDVAWFHEQRAERPELDVTVEDVSASRGMIAIQGPRSQAIVQTLTDHDLASLPYFHWVEATVAGIPLLLARTGYTGEDGFEFYPEAARTGKLWDALLEAGAGDGLVPVGLGARDTLRLEARMPLYGNELSDETSPLEAGLGWAVKLDKGEFVGRDQIAAVKEAKPRRRAVGFKLDGRSGSARTGYEVQVDGHTVGTVTSGAMSPTLGENIGLALVERDVAGVGKPLQIMIRGKAVPATQVKVPFYRRAES